MTGALVVNADDLGVSKGATLGIVRAHRDGIVTSASLATTTPFYAHALETCIQACPDLGVGLHFTLTSGRPVSSARQVPLLVGENGFFRWRFLPLCFAAALRGDPDLLEQVEIELEAQLRRLIGDGVRPDHIDSERHVHLIPGIFEKIVAAAKRHHVPFLRLGRDYGTKLVRLSHAPVLARSGGFAKSWLLSRLTRRDLKRLDGGIAYAEHLVSYLYSGRLDLVLRTALKELPPAGVTEIMVHPGLPEESRNLALGNLELERYLASGDRRKELEACIAARDWASGWQLTNFRRLAQERVPS